MGLAERIVQSTNATTYPQEDGNIPIHEFTAAISLYATGNATRNQIVNIFNLDAGQAAGLDQLLATFNGLATKADKVEWLMKLEAAGIFFQDGNIDKAQYKSIMGLV